MLSGNSNALLASSWCILIPELKSTLHPDYVILKRERVLYPDRPLRYKVTVPFENASCCIEAIQHDHRSIVVQYAYTQNDASTKPSWFLTVNTYKPHVDLDDDLP